MIICVSTSLIFSLLYYIIRLFDVWIGFESLFLTAVCYTAPFRGCVFLLDSVVCLIAITILGKKTKRKESDCFGLRLVFAVW
jgi:hypothetical protein